MGSLTQSKRSGLWVVFVVLLSGLLVGATLLLTGDRTARANPGIIYVDADASGGDGTSWAEAFTSVQEALFTADPGDEIWVAEGVYKPTEGIRYASCQEIRDASPDAPDGDYLINNGGQVVQVYCADMGTSPVEYLSLLPGENYAEYAAGGASPGTTVRTDYNRVRLRTTVWRVDISDQEYSNSTGNLDHGGTAVSSMPYGVAMDCQGAGSAEGLARIDLRDTPFFVTDPFARCGGDPGGYWQFVDEHHQVVVLHGGGNCGWVQPAPGCLDTPYNDAGGAQPILDLGYLGPDRRAAFELKSGVALYGGFEGTESSRDDRDPQENPTVLSGDIDDDDITDPDGVVADTANLRGYNSLHVVSSRAVTETALLDGFIITAGNADDANRWSGGSGGGMCNLYSSNPTLTNVTFSGNAAIEGGGMFNHYLGNPTLTNVTFIGNDARDGAGMFNNFISSPRLTNVTFDGNHAGESGGGMYNDDDSNPTLARVTFIDNDAVSNGGGMYNSSSSPSLVNVTFDGNRAKGGSGGGMYNHESSPTLTNVTFNDSYAAENGGGMHNVSSSGTTLINVIFSSNDAKDGGGMRNDMSSPTLTNVLFTGNSASQGGGLFNELSDPTLTNVTFSSNEATFDGAGMFNLMSRPTLVNGIVWGNNPDNILDADSSPTITYSDIEGGYPGEGNIDADPLFAAPLSAGGVQSAAGADGGDYRLREASPAVDAGTNAAVTVDTDLAGYTRVVDGNRDGKADVDMGAYECQLKIYLPLLLDLPSY
jgi:hypothetical protein